jgi:hypothetical protein
MTLKEVSKLPPGTKVHFIVGGTIKHFRVLSINPNYENILYLYSDGNFNDVESFLTDNDSNTWETDYEKAKETMWKQIIERAKSINNIYFNNKKSLNFEENV